MWARIENISKETAYELGSKHLSGDMQSYRQGLQVSTPIIACWMGPDLVSILGFIPQGVLTGTAYVWMEWTPAIARHRYATVRWSRDIIREAQHLYPRLIGRCTFGESSKRWLRTLGARFVGDDYIIGDWE